MRLDFCPISWEPFQTHPPHLQKALIRCVFHRVDTARKKKAVPA